MNAVVLATIVALVLAVGASYLLDARVQRTAADEFTTSGVRLGDPGENLVEWR